MAFISGIFATGDTMPEWLGRVAALFPLKHFVDAMGAAFDPFTPGAGFRWGSLAVMLAWAAAGSLVAVRFFRWEPRSASSGPSGGVPHGAARDVPAVGQATPGRIVEPGRPSMLVLVAAQVRHSSRAFWRNRAGAFFTVGFPVMLVVLLPQVFGEELLPDRGVAFPQFLTPVMAVYGVAATSYLFLAEAVASARERAVLKRAHGTPLPVWAYLGGQAGAAVLMSFVSFLAVVGAGVAVYGIEVVWAKVPALIVYLVIGIVCFSVLGMTVASLAPGEKAAGTIANVTLLPLAFVSDIFLIGGLPPVLDGIGWAFPLKHLANGVAATFNPTLPGAGWDAVHLLALAAWAIGAALLGARFFRWEPRGSG